MNTIHTWMLRAMPDCQHAADATRRLIHGNSMSLRERAALELHLAACPTCRSSRIRLKWLQNEVSKLHHRAQEDHSGHSQ